MRIIVRWAVLMLVGVLAGCGGGAVRFAPTPAPPDLGPLRYTHPTGAFTLDVPRTWAVYTQGFSNLAAASFTPPGEDVPVVTAAVVNTGAATSLPALLNRYQTEVRPDAARYIEQDRQAMGDGSWRFTGLRNLPGGGVEQVNTFIVQAGELLGVLDMVLPPQTASDPDRLDTLERLANTFLLNPASPLEATTLDTLSLVARGEVAVANLSSWLTPAGVFFVAGEVVNNTAQTISEVPVRVQLFAADGSGLAEARDVAMGYGIPPGGFAPFSLRFGQGQPQAAASYTVLVGGGEWSPAASDPGPLLGGASLTWLDEWEVTPDGQLVVQGILTNTGDTAAVAPLAIVTVFDPAGDVIATGFAQVSGEGFAAGDTLPPGRRTGYTVILPELGGEVAAVLVNIQARPGTSAEATPEVTAEP